MSLKILDRVHRKAGQRHEHLNWYGKSDLKIVLLIVSVENVFSTDYVLIYMYTCTYTCTYSYMYYIYKYIYVYTYV